MKTQGEGNNSKIMMKRLSVGHVEFMTSRANIGERNA
jgi:hypothetical protein